IKSIQTPSKDVSAERIEHEPVALHCLQDWLHSSKIVQVRATIPDHSFAVPTDLDLMYSDAGNRAQSGKLVIVLTGPRHAVAKRKPTSHCGIHDRFSEDGESCTRPPFSPARQINLIHT